MQDETSLASLSIMIPRDQTVSSWYTTAPWRRARPRRARIVYRRQDTDIVRREPPAVHRSAPVRERGCAQVGPAVGRSGGQAAWRSGAGGYAAHGRAAST